MNPPVWLTAVLWLLYVVPQQVASAKAGVSREHTPGEKEHSMGRLDGKVALISGAARGQGAVEARMFVREGAKVVFGDILDAEGKQVEAAGGNGDGVRRRATVRPRRERVAVGARDLRRRGVEAVAEADDLVLRERRRAADPVEQQRQPGRRGGEGDRRLLRRDAQRVPFP